MASQTRRSAQTSGANATAAGSNLEHWNIQHFVKELLDSINPKNEELLKLLDSYFDDTHETINFQEYLDGEEGSWESALQHFLHDLDDLYRQQLLIQDSLQSFRNNLSQNLRRVKFWTKVSAVVFTALVVIISATAAATARKATTAAAGAAAPILLGTIGTWTHSLLSKYKDVVKEQVEITRVMAVGAKITMTDLSGLHLSARRFEFLAKSSVAESGDARQVRKALMESFEELERKAADFSRDARLLAKEITLQSVIKHLDCITR